MAKMINLKKAVPVDKNLLKHLLPGERVKPVKGTEHYYVSNFGRVFSGKKGFLYRTIEGEELMGVAWKQLKPRLCRGYYVVNINSKKHYIHHIEWEAFNGWLDRLALKIIHKDGDKLNNNLNNLGVTWISKYNEHRKKEYYYREYMRSRMDYHLNDYTGVTIDYKND